MPQQTAVEWFLMTMNIRGLLPNQEIVECYKQAKQMEKEQIVNAVDSWVVNGNLKGEQYYNETYSE